MKTMKNKWCRREAMKLIIEKIKTFLEGEANAFCALYMEALEVASKLYADVGLEKTREISGTEIIMRLAYGLRTGPSKQKQARVEV